jgi:putative lipoic acid-binding regulatory protein
LSGRFIFNMDANWLINFRKKLDEHYAWPSLYTFKFIVPTEKEEAVKNLFPRHTTTGKLSKNGKYISVTINMMMPSSEAVINVYHTASVIEGIIAL